MSRLTWLTATLLAVTLTGYRYEWRRVKLSLGDPIQLTFALSPIDRACKGLECYWGGCLTGAAPPCARLYCAPSLRAIR